ncbi:MAG TPA: ABC transporter permease [Pseudonocardia sp.]|uniref:ABC transporter permease n=1 Tax=Pseudonocardia sp. TaxID=60912 RepID=UPI002F3F9CB2
MSALGWVLPAQGPVIPDFGGGACPSDAAFCWAWVTQNWGPELAPRLVEHIYITLIAVLVGLVISLVAASIAYRLRWFERGFLAFSTVLYTIPALAFFLFFVPITGLSLTTVEIGLIGYTFLLLFRNALAGLRSVPTEALAAAAGMGMTDREIFLRINLPLAVPSIMAGARIATVTVISLATIAADVTPLGLGEPIFTALHTVFRTELITAGALAILLALVADALLVLLQRAATPWIRARVRT